MNLHKMRTLALMAASSVPLAACGDGGGGGVASTPPPAASYQTLSQLSGNQSFQTGGIHLTSTQTGAVSNLGASDFGTGTTVTYTAATDTYVLQAPDGTTATFAPGNVTSSQAGAFVRYSSTSASGTDNLILAHPAIGGVSLSYTLIGNWNHIVGSTNQDTIQLAVGGIPTLASDVPRTGNASYTANVAGGGSLGPINQTASGQVTTSSTATFSANFAASSVSTSMTLVNADTLASIGSFNGTGPISSNGPGFGGTLSGTFTGGSSATGSFAGVFAGPQAAELAYGWFVNGTSGTMDGFVWGKKN